MLKLHKEEVEVFKACSMIDGGLFSLWMNPCNRSIVAKSDVVSALSCEYKVGEWTVAKHGMLYCYGVSGNPEYIHNLCRPDSHGMGCRVLRCKARGWLVPDGCPFKTHGTLASIDSFWHEYLENTKSFRDDTNHHHMMLARQLKPIEVVA